MAEGQSNKLIAHGLGISEHTVKFHVNSILHQVERRQPHRSRYPRHPARLGPVIELRQGRHAATRPAQTGNRTKPLPRAFGIDRGKNGKPAVTRPAPDRQQNEAIAPGIRHRP